MYVWMCECMYVCVCVCKHMCTYTYMHTHADCEWNPVTSGTFTTAPYSCICKYWSYVSHYVYEYMSMYVCMYVSMYACLRKCTYTHTHTQVQIVSAHLYIGHIHNCLTLLHMQVMIDNHNRKGLLAAASCTPPTSAVEVQERCTAPERPLVQEWSKSGARERSTAREVQEREVHCNTLQHTATLSNTLQHTATKCNTLQHTAREVQAAASFPVSNYVYVCIYVYIYVCMYAYTHMCTYTDPHTHTRADCECTPLYQAHPQPLHTPTYATNHRM